jgi:hypothetical protein
MCDTREVSFKHQLIYYQQTVQKILLIHIWETAIAWSILWYVKVKVKCTLVQALRLCTGRTTHRGSRGLALTLS